MLIKHNLFETDSIHKTVRPVANPKETLASEVEPVQFVGQEQDGTLLFTWEDFPPGQNEGDMQTYVGTYNPYQKSIHAVFVHDSKTNIVNATINKTHTFIGFVTYETTEKTGPQGKLQPQGVYKAFIAEIQPQNRVFYLNLERENYLKLQFVYGAYRNPTNQLGREDHLLVFLHKESIGLYHLPLARVGDDGVIMSGEPRKEQLFHRRFVWTEWDSTNQRLYIVHFLKSGKNERGQTVHQPYLKCYQFVQQESQLYTSRKDKELVLEMPLDLPIPYLKESTYTETAPYTGIPDSAINMKVLSQPSGAICLCFQHPVSKKTKSDTNGTTTIQYSIYLIHKEKAIRCQCDNIPYKAAVNGRLFFSWMDGYILVHLPGYLSHLLCVGVEYDPGMDILYSQCNNGDTVPPHLISYTSDKGSISNTGACYYDISQREAFRFSLNPEVLLDMFKSCDQLHCKMAILHYAVVQTRDLGLVKSLISSISQSPTDLETVPLLKEYLVGNTYIQLRRQIFAIEKKMLKHIPYTSRVCASNQNVHKVEPCVQCTVTYLSLPEVTITTDKHDSGADYWLVLSNHIKALSSAQNCRFNLTFAKEEAEQNENEANQEQVKKVLVQRGIPSITYLSYLAVTLKASEEPQRHDNTSFLQKISAAARSAFSRDSTTKSASNPTQPQQRMLRAQSRTDSVLGRPPPFLGKDEENFVKTNRYFSKTVELLSLHLIKFNKQESRTKMRSIAEEYVKCQMSSSRLLCHLIWSVMATEIGTDDGHLDKRGSKQEVDLLWMLERYVVSAQELGFPLPTGLSSYMLGLSFRCSRLHTFLHYVDHGVYELSPQFVLQVIEDLPDNPQDVETKWHLLHRLPQESVIQILRYWDHPTAQQAVGQVYSERVITKQPGLEGKDNVKRRLPPIPTNSDHMSEHDTFPPALTFVKYLQKKDQGLQTGESSVGVELDADYLRKAAMAFINTSTFS